MFTNRAFYFSLSIFTAILFNSCGTAKSIYADSKKQVCEDTCRLKFSKYDYNPLNTCIIECERKRSDDVKASSTKNILGE
ncbi:hypothetical protein N9N67_08475 [Bacteriovoracaceae bacterium]|nr:hypothetical protein [Bacteriovoracaceae bacterium]